MTEPPAEKDALDTRAKVGGPDAVTVTVCHSCSRTDRWQPLKARHFAGGGLCRGPIEEVFYARVTPSDRDLERCGR